jgi:formylglycine-generating enzyme required for sulfatase activity/serine/threonine protein kinase
MAATDENDEGRSANQPVTSGDSHDSPETEFENLALTNMPTQLGRYRIKKRLGGGGMGAVYLVENTELQREEALKVPHFASGDDPAVRERFIQEALAAAKLDHPNLCPIYDVGVIEGIYFLTMRLLPGKPLSKYTGRPHPRHEAVKIVAKLAEVLEHAHSKGVIHRDLKPANIMMCPGTGPTVMDFGLAKQTKRQEHRLTQIGMAMGTPTYMPPEQVKGDLDAIGPASDIYSLGVILFELLTGRLPFQGSATEVMGKVIFSEAPLPSEMLPGLGSQFDAVCSRALAKEPQERYPSMKAFADELKEMLRTLPAPTDPGKKTASKGNIGELIDKSTLMPGQAAMPTQRPGAIRQSIAKKSAADATAADEPIAKTGPHKPRAGGNARMHHPEPQARNQGLIALLVVALVVAVVSSGTVVFLLTKRGEGPTDGKETTTTPGGQEIAKMSPGGIGQHDTEKSGRSAKDSATEVPGKIAPPIEEKTRKGTGESADVFINGFGIQLVRIPAGKFKMGSPAIELRRNPFEFQHEVAVSAFHLGVYEVTQKQFRDVMGYNPSFFSADGKGKPPVKYPPTRMPAGGKDKVPVDTSDFPVENVLWEEANAFCQKLTAMDRKKPAGRVYRLATEAEWEYACRGGESSYQVFHFGDSLSFKQANIKKIYPDEDAEKGDYLGRTCKVGSYAANRFGLHDMHGNVWEWCQDWYDNDYYRKSPLEDPPGAATGSARVIRGGCWSERGQNCRSACRAWGGMAARANDLGFRVALVPSGK